jgi:hypothetical protein
MNPRAKTEIPHPTRKEELDETPYRRIRELIRHGGRPI